MKIIELNRDKISQNLIELRKTNNMTQKTFAKRLGISQSIVSNWENKVSLPSMEMVIVICNEFNLRVDDIVVYEASEQN